MFWLYPSMDLLVRDLLSITLCPYLIGTYNIFISGEIILLFFFPGVSIPTTLEVTSLSDSWLTATITPNPSKHSRDINIDLPRFPILLPPGKEEKLTLHFTSNVEVTTELTFTLVLKDTSLDEEQHKVFTVDVATRMPSIQAVSADRMNSVTFPPIQEGKSCVRSLVLISDCPSDLLLDLSVSEGSKAFTISSVQEIQKSDVSKQLVDNGQEDPRKRMNKGSTKQLCKLTDGNAIKVTLKFTAPTLTEMNCKYIKYYYARHGFSHGAPQHSVTQKPSSNLPETSLSFHNHTFLPYQ